tara:strand:- start:374 stop:688 length:315 start_codon:yes stop_codon:yes gene_type:complete
MPKAKLSSVEELFQETSGEDSHYLPQPKRLFPKCTTHARDWRLFRTTSPLVSANFVRGILVKDEYVPRATIRMAAILLDSTDQKRTVDDHHIRENEDSDFGGEL